MNQNNQYTSTLLPLKRSPQFRCGYLQVKSELSAQQGRAIASLFSRQNEVAKAVYEQRSFWIIVRPDNQDKAIARQWQERLHNIATEVREDFGHLDLEITRLEKPTFLPPQVVAQIAKRLLSNIIRLESWRKHVAQQKEISIYRYLEIYAETVADAPALDLNWKTSGKYLGTLKDYWLKHERDNSRCLGLEVSNRFANGGGIVVSLDELVGQRREELLAYTLHPKTKEAIEKSGDREPVVLVKSENYGSAKHISFVLDGLEIAINQENARRLGLDYEAYRSRTKIELSEWQHLRDKARQQVSSHLEKWGIIASDRYTDSESYPDHFYVAPFNKQTIEFLFGRDTKSPSSRIKPGLSKGGVYRRHAEFENVKAQIPAIGLNLSEQPSLLLTKIEAKLKELEFSVEFKIKERLRIQGEMSEKDATSIDRFIDRAIALEPKLIIVILPENDKILDDTEQGSYYHYINGKLLTKGIASQMVRAESLGDSNILNNIVLGILAKLGNVPFVLAEPLQVADYFIGLDVSRIRKKRASGTQNACACVRLYGARGEFIQYKLADYKLEGEEIPKKALRDFLISEELAPGQKVMILRDGRFRGNEVKSLSERASAIGVHPIFVEITKSGTGRLFNCQVNTSENSAPLSQPTQYLILKHSEREATVVITKPRVGLAQPVRVTLLATGDVPALDDVLEAVFKLCLLHYGSYQEAGLPMPIYASDKIGYKVLKGMYHVQSSGDRQWWL